MVIIVNRATAIVFGTKARVWASVVLLGALAALDVWRAFGAFADRSMAASIWWALLALWLLGPPIAIVRLFANVHDPPPQTLFIGIQFALLGYIPVTIGMRLLERALGQ
jgi:hypothetical protein